MPSGRPSSPPRPNAASNENCNAPVLLPFTIQTAWDIKRSREAGPDLARRAGFFWSEPDSPTEDVVVVGVTPDGPASRSGAIAVEDAVLEVNGVRVRGTDEIVRAAASGAPGELELRLKSGSDGGLRSVSLRLPQSGAGGGANLPPPAHVPTTTLTNSIQRYIECILCNPLQSEVMHTGVAADPDFGCLGADLEFGLERVGLAAMTNAIVQGERRLTELDVTNLDIEVREAGEVHVRPGIRVLAKLARGGEGVSVDLEILELTRKRRTNRLRRRREE
jgi:hypothetical protein